jgi:hypothetical protein
MAALKYLLIPEANYKSLLTRDNEKMAPNIPSKQMGDGLGDDLTERGFLDLAKRQLQRTRKKRTKNDSAKNLLFNQRLRSYLKARNRLLSKPFKVQLESIGKGLLAKPGAQALVNEDGETEMLTRNPEVLKPDDSLLDYSQIFTPTPKTPTQQVCK